MHFALHLIALVLLAFISHEHEVVAQYVPPYTSTVMPITKHTDTSTTLYSVSVMTKYVNLQYMHTSFLIDTDAPHIWYDCILQWNPYPGSCPGDTICAYPVSCEEDICTDVRSSYSYQSPSCPLATNSSTLPGWGFCTCPVNVMSPVTGDCDQVLLNYDAFTVNTSDGRNPLEGFYGAYPNAACGNSSLLKSFPANVSGVMSFSSSPLSLVTYLYQPLKKILALCLPSSSSTPGVLFVGTGPYYLLPHSDVDVRSLLSYTPLLTYPNSFGYFIGVNEISIDRIPITIPLGNSTTKISTIEPYTVLRTDVYNSLVRMFSIATIFIPRAHRVAPFGLCLRTQPFEQSRVGLKVPNIVFKLQNGENWTIFGANSMIQVTRDVECLAFVDGGSTAEHAIVIGTFQMEDNFLVFDLEKSTFGFSSSLLYNGTSCANFNFTNGSG